MPDKTGQAKQLARDIMSAATVFMNTQRKLDALVDLNASQGLNLSDFDADFAADDELKHLTGESLTAVLSSTIAVGDYIRNNYHHNNFDAVRG